MTLLFARNPHIWSPIAQRALRSLSSSPISSIRSRHKSFETDLKKRSNENKELVLSILKLTTTRRETRFYLNKYSTFSQDPKEANKGPYRVILIKLRGNIQDYDTDDLKKFSTTLDYIKRLGASPIILLDPDFLSGRVDFNFTNIDNFLFNQFNHLTQCLASKSLKMVPLRSLISTNSMTSDALQLDSPSQIIESLTERNVPVIFPYVFDNKNSKEWIIDSTQYLSTLVQALHSIENATATVEKLIFIDKLGGIPSVERFNDSHVFINLSQEFDRILSELNIGHLSFQEKEIHMNNLSSMKKIMNSVEYTDLTGLITTLKVANESLDMNPIIYNILTDRSLISSSLPLAKYQNKENINNKISKTTIIKKGLEVMEYKSFKEIDLQKFKHLIDDSFKRRLNIDDYLARVEPILLKILVIGDYDGIAIVTNETSKTTGMKVPYLDKFAISRNAQGSLGVADMIFNFLRRQYRDRLLWRSKKVNPVNGWYFQRSNGSLGLEDSEFRIFWVGKKISAEELQAYSEIGQSIVPSWED